MTLTQLFKNIADAIRNKKGTTGTIKATNFASEISSITLATGTANPENVLVGKTFSKTGANGLEGSMPNKSGWSATVNANSQSVYIPKGYHDGNYKVNWSNTGTGTAPRDNVSSNYTFTSEASGTKVSGTLIDSGMEPTAGSITQYNGYLYLYHTDGSDKWSQRRIVQSAMKTALSNLGNATASQVQSGKTFTSSSGVSVTGTLPYRGVAQEVTTYGSGDWDTDNPYFAINKIPQGIYASEGYEWGPEVRIRTKYLGTATADKVLSGYTYTSKDAVVGSGTMTNQGSWSATVNPGSSVTIPAGYHNGSGVVSANGGAGRSRACSWTYTTAKSFTERLDSGYSGKYVTQIFFFCSNDCRWMVFSNLYAIDTSGNEFAVFDDTNTNTWYLSYVAPINKYIDHFEWRVTNTQNNQGYDFVYCSALLVEYK